MSISENFDAALSLTDLQTKIDAEEPGVGPVDGLSIDTQNGTNVSAIVFDTAVTILAPITSLAAAGAAIPSGKVAYVRGSCYVGGAPQDLVAYVAFSEKLLVTRTVSFLRAFGWSRAQAIGIAASIKFESGFDPAATGDNGTAYGLCQWRGQRQTDFLQSQGMALTGSTFREQLAFINWELGHTEHVAGGLLRATTTVEDAAQVVCVQYERPKNPTADSAQRVSYAKQIDAQLGP